MSREALKILELIRESEEFQKVIVFPEGNEIIDRFKYLNIKYGFIEYALHDCRPILLENQSRSTAVNHPVLKELGMFREEHG